MLWSDSASGSWCGWCSGRPDESEPSAPPRHHGDGTPADGAQRNFTDPASRIMLTRSGWMQAYNAEIAVDADHQIIVGQMLT